MIRRAVAELTIVIVSPALDAATRRQRTGVRTSSGNRADAARQAADVDRRQLLIRRAVAELTIVIVSPALDAAACGQRTSMEKARGNRTDAARQATDVDGCEFVCRRPVAELTRVIVSPALDAAARCQRTGVITTCGNRTDAARQATDVDGCELLRRRAVAELTIAIVSPALDAPARRQCTGVINTCGNRTRAF